MLNKKVQRIGLVVSVLGSLHSIAHADTMFSTGGYAREFQKMEMMAMIDADDNHMVTAAEFETYYSNVFARLDADKNGELSVKEWVGVKNKPQINIATGGYSREIRNTKVMDGMDADGNHMVSKDEFINYHKKIFEGLDTSGDKQLDPQEWLAKLVG